MLPHSDSHCFIFRPEFQSEVWKHRSRSQRRSFSQCPQSGPSHPLNCSPHNHIKRFRKPFFLFFLLLLCFSSPEQCPSAAGSHNSPPAHLRPSSRPRYLFFLIWPGPASTAASHCLSEGSTRGAGASPNTLVFVSGSAPAAPTNLNFLKHRWSIKEASLAPEILKAFGLWTQVPVCACNGETKSPSIRWPPRWASRCVFVTVPCQEGGLERVLRTNPLWLRKCSSVLASLWLANRAFLSAGRAVPLQGALRDTDPLRRSRGSSGISR